MVIIMRLLLIIVSLFLLSGCSHIKVNDTSYEDLVSNAVSSKYSIINTYRTGYKYYVPTNLDVTKKDDYNETLEDVNYKYYLYVDVISYYNRVIANYTVNNDAVYSQEIKYEDKYGYIEINKWKNDRYLLEIMYNYAKIEVIVNEDGIKNAVNNAIIILSSIEYNNNILENIVGDNVLTSKEIDFNIFETKKTESNFLTVSEQDIYEEDNSSNDPDLVN